MYNNNTFILMFLEHVDAHEVAPRKSYQSIRLLGRNLFSAVDKF